MSLQNLIEKIEWREIPGHKGYFASECGKVLSKRRTVPVILKPSINWRGYCEVGIWSGNKRCHMKVHRLIAMAFGVLTDLDLQINHKDGNKQNNQISNLEAVTNKENLIHANMNGLMKNVGESSVRSKLRYEDVKNIRRLRKEGWSYRQLIDLYKISHTHVSGICRGKSWKYQDSKSKADQICKE